MPTCTADSPPIVSCARRSRCWPVHTRTRSGGAPPRTISCGRCCASSTRPSWRSSPRGFTLGIASPEARATLAIAPTPAAAAKLSVSRVAAALRRAGRRRGIDQTAAEIKAELRKPQLHQPVLVENAMGKNAQALLAVLDTACANVDELGQASAELFQQHPDYAIITSFPGLADSTGARVLAEIGDDRARFTDARALKAYAGSAPFARASGR